MYTPTTKLLPSALQIKQRTFAVKAGGVTGETAVGTYDTMARDNYGDGIETYGTANGLSRHAREAAPDGYLPGYVSVGDRRAIRDGLQQIPDSHAEGGASQKKRRSERRYAATEIVVEPSGCLLQDGVCLGRFEGRRSQLIIHKAKSDKVLPVALQ